MIRHCLRQQPPRPQRDQRAPPQGKTGVSGAQQQVQAPPHWKAVPCRTPTSGWPNQVRDSVEVLNVSPLAG